MVDYILSHAENVPYQSVQAIARLSHVSTATVIRLSHRAGFPDFKAFKIELGQDVASRPSEMFQTIRPDDSGPTLVQKVFLGNIQSLRDTLSLLDLPTLTRVAMAIARSKRVVFVGLGGSGSVARDAAMRFAHLDLQSDAYDDPYTMLIQSLRLRTRDICVGISHSGRSVTTVECLRIAQKQKATTVGISNYLDSPLHAASSYFFCTAFPESRVRSASLSSHVAQTCLIDALYLLVAHHRKGTWHADRIDSLTDKLVRLPGS